MSEFRCGFSRQVITPTVPVSLAGYFTLRYWTHVEDDLLAQAVAFRQGDELAVLVQFDLVSASNEIMAGVRARCADIPGLAPENLLFTASHTHTAPEIRGHRRGGNPEYTSFAMERAAAAVHEAVADLQPACLRLGRAEDDRFAFNRRYWMDDGTVTTNPPRRDPRIVRPEGPIDPEIGLLALDQANGRRVLLANIVNHPDTIAGCGVSADWHGFVRRTLEAQSGDLRVVTLTGAAGNINHFDPRGPATQSGYDFARRIGEGYAASIAAALPSLRDSSSQNLCARATTFVTGPREISEQELATAREHAAAFTFDESRQLTSEDLANQSPAALKYFADRLLEVAADRSDRELEVHALRLGETTLVTLPGEPFTEIGLAIKQDMLGGQPTLIAALNQDVTYIPNRANFGRGGYETTPRCSPYSIETANHLLAAVREILVRLG
jgi:hypothetical protein